MLVKSIGERFESTHRKSQAALLFGLLDGGWAKTTLNAILGSFWVSQQIEGSLHKKERTLMDSIVHSSQAQDNASSAIRLQITNNSDHSNFKVEKKIKNDEVCCVVVLQRSLQINFYPPIIGKIQMFLLNIFSWTSCPKVVFFTYINIVVVLRIIVYFSIIISNALYFFIIVQHNLLRMMVSIFFTTIVCFLV